MGTDKTQPEVQPDPPVAAQEPAPDASATDPEASPAPAVPVGTEPQVTPDPPAESQEFALAARISGTPDPRLSAPPAGDTPVAASPVYVDSKSARDDNDALEGQFCQVVSGPHQGRRGLFDSVATYDPQTGYPTRIVVRTRDAQNELLSVDYAAVRPTPDYSGGR